MIDGLMLMVIAPDESLQSAVTTNCCSSPVDEYDTGLTANTPAMVKTSPFFSDVAPDAQPSLTRDDPVC